MKKYKTKDAAVKLDIERRHSSFLRGRRESTGESLRDTLRGAKEGEEFQDKQLPHSSYNEVTEFEAKKIVEG